MSTGLSEGETDSENVGGSGRIRARLSCLPEEAAQSVRPWGRWSESCESQTETNGNLESVSDSEVKGYKC